MVKVRAEFLGGLDVIVNKQRVYDLDIPGELTVGGLMDYIVEKLIQSPRDVEVFIENGTVRPGIITLVNDTDWELEGEKECVLEDGDVVSFTSTLHGG